MTESYSELVGGLGRSVRYRARRYRARDLGPDLEAELRVDGRLVKLRDVSLTGAAFSITPRQKKRIARTALVFLQGHPELAALSPRFDAILVAPRRWPRHIEGAWRSDELHL